jgi:DNA-binding FadR family transcriptional regulator
MKDSLVVKATERLARGIVGGEYPENKLPSQEALHEQFKMSRTVIREAISTLISRGMLQVQMKAGTLITPTRRWRMIDGDVVAWRLLARQTDPAFVRDLAGFRALIEPAAAAQAASHASEIDRRVIGSTYKALLAANDQSGYMAADIEFHTAILMASGNQIMEQMVELIRALLLTAYSDGRQSILHDDVEREILARLVGHIEAHDASAASAAMAELIEIETDKLGRLVSKGYIETNELYTGNVVQRTHIPDAL